MAYQGIWILFCQGSVLSVKGSCRLYWHTSVISVVRDEIRKIQNSRLASCGGAGLQRGRWISEFKTRLVCKGRSRPVKPCVKNKTPTNLGYVLRLYPKTNKTAGCGDALLCTFSRWRQEGQGLKVIHCYRVSSKLGQGYMRHCFKKRRESNMKFLC